MNDKQQHPLKWKWVGLFVLLIGCSSSQSSKPLSSTLHVSLDPTKKSGQISTPIPITPSNTLLLDDAAPVMPTITFPSISTTSATDWPTGKIVFNFHGDEPGTDIYVLEFLETGLVQTQPLTSDRVSSWPLWSPDGSQVAYASNRTGNLEIYIVNADGTGDTQITYDPAENVPVDWSPDGQWLLTASYLTDDLGAILGNSSVWLVHLTEMTQRRLTDPVEEDIWPIAWSPDGEFILFRVDEPLGTGLGRVGVMDADGTDQWLLMDVNGHEQHSAAWSPNGRWIAFYDRDTTYWQPQEGILCQCCDQVNRCGSIYLYDVETGVVTNLTPNSALAYAFSKPFAWSPDSNEIAVIQTQDSNHDKAITLDDQSGLVIVNVNAGLGQQLGQFNILEAVWSPDGRWLVSASSDKRLHLTDVTSLEYREILDESGSYYDMTWIP